MPKNPRAPKGQDKPQREFEGPVAWLLGRQLLSSMKSTLLYVAFGSKLDARDWMQAEEFPASDRDQAEHKWRELLNDTNTGGQARDFWRKGKKEFWFDYIADTGDSMRATYSIAYLCLSDMVAELSGKPDATPHLSAYSEWLKFVAHRDAPTDTNIYQNADLNCKKVDEDKQLRLPRGQFLLVGGDTTYHLSDYEGLHARFQNPFSWAFKDIRKDGRLWKEDEEKSWDDLRRPLFGIPGNHDYFDQLDGFRRQFHRPVKPDVEVPANRPFDAAQLSIPGFVRCQSASYIALRLPFDWLLWGLDTELGNIDERQRKFFRDIKVKDDLSLEDGEKPDKLIVATCAPTTAFGKYAGKDDEKSANAFSQLSLPMPFLNRKQWRREYGEIDLDEGQCRLDLSGDVHHYARYWGTDARQYPRGEKDKEKLQESYYYASVVSGLGGAFHHPSTTYAGEISEQVLYPSVKDSREEVARKIFNPWTIIKGGGIWAIGALLAFLLFFAATIGNSSRQAIQNLPPLVWTGITGRTEIEPTVPVEQKPEQVGHHWPLTYVFGDNLKELVKRELKDDKKFFHFWGKNPVSPPADYYWGVGLAFASLFLLGFSFWPTEHTYGKYHSYEEESMRARRSAARRRRSIGGKRMPEPARKILDKALDVSETVRGNFAEEEKTKGWYSSLMLQFNLLNWPLVAVSIICLWGAILIMDAFRGFLTPYGHSLLVMLTLAWATMAVILALRYSDWLSLMASKITVTKWHWVLVWALSLSAALGVICGFALFGRYNTASDLLTDILLMIVTLAIFGGLSELGRSKIKEVTKGWYWRLFGCGLGLFHALLQFLIPFLLVRKGNALAWIIWAALMIVMPFAGWWVMKKNWRWLPIAWFGFGIVMLLLPHAAFYASKYFNILEPSMPPQTTFTAEPGGVMRLLALIISKLGIASVTATEPSGWMLLIACFVAAGVGLLMACTWLSWYLAVALYFNGHNNEAGGAAQIEKFKQFIRFRLTEHDLTGFVIAVDEPKEHGSQLKPRLIDVIYLRQKRGAKTKATNAHA